jgi:hypothetical protein
MATDVQFQDEDIPFQDVDTLWVDHALQSVAYGVQVPDITESPESWQTWFDALGIVPAVSGDINWGALVVEEACYSPVRRLAEGSKTLTVVKNKYGTGTGGTVFAYIRGSTTEFTWNNATPTWQLYTVPIFCTWTYVQLKVDII